LPQQIAAFLMVSEDNVQRRLRPGMTPRPRARPRPDGPQDDPAEAKRWQKKPQFQCGSSHTRLQMR